MWWVLARCCSRASFQLSRLAVGGWGWGLDLGTAETWVRALGDPGELVWRRTLAGGGRLALRCGLTRFSLAPCASPGGPRHHDPEEQVKKIRWQHHFDQLHPQTGRRLARGGGTGAGWAGGRAPGAGVRGPSADPTRRSGASGLRARLFPAQDRRSGCVLLPLPLAREVFGSRRLRTALGS